MEVNPYETSVPVDAGERYLSPLPWPLVAVGLYCSLPLVVAVGCILLMLVTGLNYVMLAGAAFFGAVGTVSLSTFLAGMNQPRSQCVSWFSPGTCSRP